MWRSGFYQFCSISRDFRRTYPPNSHRGEQEKLKGTDNFFHSELFNFLLSMAFSASSYIFFVGFYKLLNSLILHALCSLHDTAYDFFDFLMRDFAFFSNCGVSTTTWRFHSLCTKNAKISASPVYAGP